MKIQPSSPEGVSLPLKPKALPSKGSSAAPAGEVAKTEQGEAILNLLRQEPEIRSEVVERAQRNLEDPSYPSEDVLRKVAQNFVEETF